jgi:hypothetical protein
MKYLMNNRLFGIMCCIVLKLIGVSKIVPHAQYKAPGIT